MADLVINERDAERLRELARIENRPIEEIVTQMIDTYSSHRYAEHVTSNPNRTDYMSKLYAHARAYWQRINDTERLSLTDEQLDDQFWCIDPDGIPRLKSEQGKLELPPDNLATLLEAVREDNPTGEVEAPINYRESLNNNFPDYLMRRQAWGNNAQSDTDR